MRFNDRRRRKPYRPVDPSRITGHGADDGYDAMKDANLMAGRDKGDIAGLWDALEQGWVRVKDDDED